MPPFIIEFFTEFKPLLYMIGVFVIFGILHRVSNWAHRDLDE